MQKLALLTLQFSQPLLAGLLDLMASLRQLFLPLRCGFIAGLVQPLLALCRQLLLFLLVVPVFTVFLAPLFAQLSRRHEFEADAYAMAQANGADLASALLKLYEDNASTLTPDPLYVKFHYSHPPAVERLARMPSPAFP